MQKHETALDPAPGINAIDLISKYRRPIMGFATLWILIFHEWELVFSAVPVLAYAEKIIRRLGFCGVDIFLFLSGMGLTYAIRGRSVGTFYARRLKRLVLPWAAMAVLFTLYRQWSLLELLQHISGYVFWTENIYDFLWFFYAIFPLYLIFPWYYRFYLKQENRVRFFAAVLLCWLILAVGLKDVIQENLYGFLNRIPIFLTGICFGAQADKEKFVLTRARWCLLWGILLAGLVLSVLTNYGGLYLLVPVSNAFLPNYLMTLSLPVILAGLLEKLPKAWNGGLCKFLGFYGTISFEVYCVEDPLGKLLHEHLMDTVGIPLVVNGIVFVLITAGSWGMYTLFDRFWKAMDRKTGK